MGKKVTLMILLIAAVVSLVGCSGGKFGSGELALFIADKPVNNVEQVLVTIKEVQVKRVDSQWETINDFADHGGEKEFDLLQLRFDEELLGQKTLTAGEYTGIRLIVAADEENQAGAAKYSGKSRVVYIDSTEEPIFIPSGTQTGLKINENFEVQEDTITELTLDFKVAEMMHSAGNGDIILRPSAHIEVQYNQVTGSIAGRVLSNTDADSDGENDPITDQDIEVAVLNNGEIVKTALASAEETILDDGTVVPAGSYLIRGLEEGTYYLEAYAVDEAGEKIENPEVPYVQTGEVTVEVVAEEEITAPNIILESGQ